MKITGYKLRERRPHVDVLETMELDVSLSHAVDEEFGPLEEPEEHGVAVSFSQRRVVRRFRRHRSHDDEVPGPLSLRGEGARGAVETKTGLIVYGSRSALIDFLLARWAPVGTSELDEHLREIQGGRSTAAQRRVALEAFIHKSEGCQPGRRLPLVEADSLDLNNHGWVRLDTRGETHYCRARSEALAVAIERTMEVGELAVPYLEWLIVGTGHKSRVLHIDRGVTRRYNGYDKVPDAVYRRFDEHGRGWPTTARGRVPMAEMWPRFVLRIPEHMDCTDVVAGVDEGLPPCFLLEPQLLSDPMRLAADLPVLDDPAAVRAVLARTVGGVYLPQNPPVSHVDPPSVPLLVGALPTPGAWA